MDDVTAERTTRVESPGGVARAAELGRMLTGSQTLAIAAAGGVALVLGLIRLGAPSFWVDESFTANSSKGSLAELFSGYHGLYYTLENAWERFAGTSELALRLPSVVGAVIAACLLVVLAGRVFDRRVALLAGLLLAASPFVVKWSQQARGYTLMLAVSLAATLLLVRAVERGTRASWAVYGAASAVLAVWHPVAALLLAPSHAVLLYQRRARVLPHGLLAGLIVLAIGVPWAAQIAIRSTGEGVAMNWLKFPTLEVASRALLDVSGVAGLGLLLAVLGLWTLRRTGDGERAAWLGAWAFAPFALALLVSIVRPIYLDRYLIVAAPAFALLAAVALVGAAPRLRAVLAAAVVLATTVGLVHWYGEGVGGNWRGEDWRGAVSTVLEQRVPGQPIVVAPWSAAPAARYYGADVVDTSTADSIWVLTWSETGDDLTAADRSALGFGDHRPVERLVFGRRVTAQLWARQR